MAQYKYALQFVTEELKGDREVVMAALAQDCHTLQLATNDVIGRPRIRHGRWGPL